MALSQCYKTWDQAYQERLDHVTSELRLATTLTPEVFARVINAACTRLPILTKAGKTARFRALIEAGAQLDAALALVELELPQWRLRRLILDDRQWYCSLSRQPNLPIALDDTADGQHEDIVLSILIAFVEAAGMARVVPQSPAIAVPAHSADGYPMCCDNFS